LRLTALVPLIRRRSSYTDDVIVPMQPSKIAEPFSDPNWLFEPKWDGYRALCYYDEKSARFISLRNNDLTKRFVELQNIAVRAHSAIIDGEIVAIDDAGLPSFDELRKRRRSCSIVFYAFDVIELNGKDVRDLPLYKRKALLKQIVAKGRNNRIRFTEHIVGEGLALFEQLEDRQIEGMVAKKLDSKYESGRTRKWLKVKTSVGKEETRKRIENWIK
jgi:bifunctional non-homologous end joining protein LigD